MADDPKQSINTTPQAFVDDIISRSQIERTNKKNYTYEGRTLRRVKIDPPIGTIFSPQGIQKTLLYIENGYKQLLIKPFFDYYSSLYGIRNLTIDSYNDKLSELNAKVSDPLRIPNISWFLRYNRQSSSYDKDIYSVFSSLIINSGVVPSSEVIHGVNNYGQEFTTTKYQPGDMFVGELGCSFAIVRGNEVVGELGSNFHNLIDNMLSLFGTPHYLDPGIERNMLQGAINGYTLIQPESYNILMYNLYFKDAVDEKH